MDPDARPGRSAALERTAPARSPGRAARTCRLAPHTAREAPDPLSVDGPGIVSAQDIEQTVTDDRLAPLGLQGKPACCGASTTVGAGPCRRRPAAPIADACAPVYGSDEPLQGQSTTMIDIRPESPLGPDLGLLMARHRAEMHAETPPESIHMLDASELAAPGIRFYVMRQDGQPVGMGALKRIDATHAEIKSMHVLAELRGRGLSRRMLEHLVAEARAAGMRRLSLETGVQPGFAAARALYARAGFVECGPFGGYSEDPNSLFMTLPLA